MKNSQNKFDRHQEVARAQVHQKLQNCALLCAVETLESGTLNGGERVAKGDMLDDVADRLTPLTLDDAERWLRKLCGNVASDLTMTDWHATVEAVRK